MTRSRCLLAALTASAVMAGVPATAAAQRYDFKGNVAAVTATSVIVQVANGNRPALRAMIGAAQPLTFIVDQRTRYTVWKGNRPYRTSLNAIGIGDSVWVHTNGRKRAKLADLLSRPVRTVRDVSAKDLGRGRLYLFRGVCTAKDTAANRLTINVHGGNWRALHAMLGSPIAQTFAYSDSTSFVSWHTGRPRVVGEEQVPCGPDGTRVAIRVRAPKLTPLATLVTTPAALVNVREPLKDDEPPAT
jgi:hypothetical protein